MVYKSVEDLIVSFYYLQYKKEGKNMNKNFKGGGEWAKFLKEKYQVKQ